MMLNAYSVFDLKTLAYHPPFYAATDAAAIRIVSDVVVDPNTQLGRHPADFVLYAVGIFDDQKGALLAHSPLVHVADCAALVPPAAAVLPFAKEA